MQRIRTWARGSVIKTGLLIAIGLFLVIQLVPYGHDHSNPPATRTLAYDTPRTEQLAADSCGACHSNGTDWPIESNVAPFSWLIQHDVEDGRAILNFDEWDRLDQAGPDEIAEAVTGGEMPPLQYKVLHPSSKLSDTEKAELADGLTRSIAQDPPGP